MRVQNRKDVFFLQPAYSTAPECTDETFWVAAPMYRFLSGRNVAVARPKLDSCQVPHLEDVVME